MNNNLLYVCSPYRGDTKRNKEYARELTRLAIDNGFVPVTVHLYITEVTNDDIPEEREKGMMAGKAILANCKYILVGRRYGISEGMAGEMETAAGLGLIRLYEKDGELHPADFEKDQKTDWDKLTEAEKFKEVFKAVVKREGARQLLSWLEASGFFEAPAGMKHHGAFPGGLVAHSNNVYRRLMEIFTAEGRKDPELHRRFNNETLAVAALLHDVCKVGVYHPEEEDGQQSYSYKDSLPLGHGEKSVYLIMRNGLTLTNDEALAIRWHMGAFDKAAQADFRDLDRAQKQCPLVVMLHMADMMATHFDEKEVTDSELLQKTE